LADETVLGQSPPGDPLEATARGHIREARKVDPTMAEATLVEASLLPLSSYEEALSLLDRAKREDPDNPVVLSDRADQLRTVGRMQESIRDAKRAADLDPISPRARGQYILALAYAGRVDAARRELQDLEQLWPGTGILQDIKFRFYLRFGDPKIALQMARWLNFGGENQERFLIARANPTEQNIDYMISHARAEGPSAGLLGFLVQALGEFGRNEQAVRLLNTWPSQDDVRSLGDVYFRPALNGLRHDPRFMKIAAKAGLVSYWRRTGDWPDFCSEPDLPYNCKDAAARIST
jgi:tetratricopeptide (TPR) repeat protein